MDIFIITMRFTEAQIEQRTGVFWSKRRKGAMSRAQEKFKDKMSKRKEGRE